MDFLGSSSLPEAASPPEAAHLHVPGTCFSGSRERGPGHREEEKGPQSQQSLVNLPSSQFTKDPLSERQERSPPHFAYYLYICKITVLKAALRCQVSVICGLANYVFNLS